jgi:hypothetical protein
MVDLEMLSLNRAKPTNKFKKAIKTTYQVLKPWSYQLDTNEKTYISKIAKGFDFGGFRLCYNKILLAKNHA